MAKLKGLSSPEKKAKDFIEDAFDDKNKPWIETADRLNNMVKGKYESKTRRRKDRVVINEAYSLLNLIVPSMIFQTPYITCRAKGDYLYKKVKDGIQQTDIVTKARNLEAVINNHIRRIDQLNEDRKALQDSLTFPFGVVKDGYKYETISGDDKDYVVEDGGYHKRINPKDFGYHQMATGPDDSIKLVHRIVMTKGQAKKRGIDVDKLELEPGIPEHTKKKMDKFVKKMSCDEDFFTFFEVTDQEEDMVYLYGGENKVLIKKNKRVTGYTSSDYSLIRFTRLNDDFEGIPMLSMIEPELHLLNEIFSLMIQHLRKFPGQVFANKGAVDEDQIEKIIRGTQGSFHIVNDISQMLRQPPLQMGQEYFQIVNLVLSIIDRVIGVPDFQRLSGGANRMSATAASFIQGDATIRRNYFLTIVKNFVLEGIYKQASLKQQFQDEKEFIKGMGELQHEEFYLDKRDYEDIECTFDFDVDNMAATNEAQFNNINNLLTIMSGNEFFKPILANLSPYKTGKKLFSIAKLPYESMTYDGAEEVVHYSPEKEIELAEKGELMPRPKKNEDADYHIKVHRDYIQSKIQKIGPEAAQQDPVLAQVIEHLAETEMIKEQSGKSAPAQPQMAMPQEMSQEEAMTPEGPGGPMQQI